ncbi:lipid A-modifier LpxR family protein [uncultured Brevundimonas sp.]|uniref:lipid A-modifier LpxR family protein n=1 Tax=uncultured Brevundimonas sp. TaxID=213418 RepID=UPI0030ED2E0B
MTILTGMGMALICASADSAESQTAPTSWIVDTTVAPDAAPPATVADLLIQLDRTLPFGGLDGDGFSPSFDTSAGLVDPATGVAPRAIDRRDIWFETSEFTDRLRLRTEGALRRADGAPVPVSPLEPAALEAEHYDLSYIRGWPATLGYTASGLEVTLIPHAGVGVGTRGGTAEAGAMLQIGTDMERLVPAGREAFGERARWYIYAAGSGRAVGYNFARTRDGDFARSGVSHDSSNFIGDASLGVAFRKGDIQSSIGLVYRELGPSDLRVGQGVDTDVSEGLIAFQLSIKPDW